MCVWGGVACQIWVDKSNIESGLRHKGEENARLDGEQNVEERARLEGEQNVEKRHGSKENKTQRRGLT